MSTNYAGAYHDNAPAYSSLAVCEYLVEKNISTLPLFSVHQTQSVLKGTRFDDLEEIKANTTRILKALTSSDFKSCLKVGERGWNKCVILGGEGTTVMVLRFSLCKIIEFDFLEKKSRYLIVIPRTTTNK